MQWIVIFFISIGLLRRNSPNENPALFDCGHFVFLLVYILRKLCSVDILITNSNYQLALNLIVWISNFITQFKSLNHPLFLWGGLLTLSDWGVKAGTSVLYVYKYIYIFKTSFYVNSENYLWPEAHLQFDKSQEKYRF